MPSCTFAIQRAEGRRIRNAIDEADRDEEVHKIFRMLNSGNEQLKPDSVTMLNCDWVWDLKSERRDVQMYVMSKRDMLIIKIC
jgi:hypothetical protein